MSSLNFWLMMLAVGIAGGLGSALRLLLSNWHGRLPWGVLLGNSLASVVVGFGAELGGLGLPMNTWLVPLLATGFAGGLSTFSSWAAQTVQLFAAKDRKGGLWNWILNLVVPVACVILGMILGGVLLK